MYNNPEYMPLYISEWKKEVRNRRIKSFFKGLLVVSLFVGVGVIL